MIYSFDYDSTYDPAIPLVEVKIRKVEEDTFIQIPAIVDSGAGGTLIPMHFIQQIGAAKSGWMRIVNLDSVSRRIPRYLLHISIGTLTIGAIQVGGDNSIPQMILGRDFLNHFIVTLNGLANEVQISQ